MSNPNPFLINGRPPGPLARFLAGVIALALLAISIFLGFIFFVSALVAAAIIAIVLWFKRKQAGPPGASPFQRERQPGSTLEGDFEVLKPDPPRRDGPAP